MSVSHFPPLSPPIHAHKCKHSPYSIICNCDLCETHGSNYVSSTSKPVSTRTVCKPAHIVSCNKPVIFSPVYKSHHASNICISKTVCCSVSCKLISTLIKSEPVKSFVMCKTVCVSNVSMAKEFNSVNYCLVTYTEHPMNVISFIVRKSVVSYRTACPVDFDAFVETINATLLSTYCCASFKILHHITCHFHFGTSTAFSKATCNTLSLLLTIISLITTFPINASSSSPLSLLLPPPPSASSQSV